MYPIVGSSLIEYILEMSYGGQTLLSVLHYRLTTSGGVPTNGAGFLAAFLNRMNTVGQFVPLYQNTQSETLSFVRHSAQAIFPTRYIKTTATLGSFGNRAVEKDLPQNVAISITKRGVLGGRGKTGRLQVPASSSTLTNVGQVLVPVDADLTNLANYLKTDVTVTFTDPYVLRPVVLNVADKASSQDVIDTEVQTELRTMHRRTVGLGI